MVSATFHRPYTLLPHSAITSSTMSRHGSLKAYIVYTARSEHVLTSMLSNLSLFYSPTDSFIFTTSVSSSLPSSSTHVLLRVFANTFCTQLAAFSDSMSTTQAELSASVVQNRFNSHARPIIIRPAEGAWVSIFVCLHACLFDRVCAFVRFSTARRRSIFVHNRLRRFVSE